MNPAVAEIAGRVDRLFDRFERMTDAELMLLRSVWEEQDASAREQAWARVKATLRESDREPLLERARDRVGAWVNNYSPPMAAGEVSAMVTGSGMDPGSIRKVAIPPILDAIAATIAAEELSARDLTLLLEPLSRLRPHATAK